MPTRTTSPTPTARRSTSAGGRAVGLLAAASLLLGALAIGGAAGAPVAAAQTTCGNTDATPTLTVTPGSLSASATSTVTVTATDYLVPPHACGSNVFGGIYVFFGWVAPGGQWGPSWRSSTSAAGQYGVSYSYPGEGGGGDTRDDGSGVVRLVSFTNGGMSGTETPFHMDAAGNWSTTINVRGALYSWKDISTGATNTVDCRAVQCGIFSIGAHGKASRTNEVFTPITFRDEGPPPTVAPGGVTAAPPAGSSGGRAPAGGTGATAAGGATAPAGSSGSATTAPAGDTGDTTTTVAPTETTAPETSTSEASVESASEDREVVAGEAAGVQDFDGGGGGAGGLAIGLVALVLVVAGATVAGWFVRRRRAAAPEGP
ncbi:hypothetical protein [Dermatobacter hominis]|uniref:hypothetical protein n=1 Tax=Dermatobacter hominis TaxID=2884263 RepID=UPI001D11D87C|nr:hypothetical protein [Dermatobacter hominis]UDY35922.1 hypothetical protein LH044_21715 [Dermatobacter hominis]